MTYQSGPAMLTVFSDLDCDIAPGERVAVIGESGAGKSTLLHLLGGLDQPASGAVFYDGHDIYSIPEPDRARFRNGEIGFVWQQSSLLPEFTAEENVAMPLLIAGQARETARQTARRKLAEVGLAQRAWHRAGELSGGEQQRVALARALVANPRTLLADEPTGNLDFRTGESVAALLAGLHQTYQFTTVIVTHNLAFAQTLDRVLQLEKGVVAPWSPATAPGQPSHSTGQEV